MRTNDKRVKILSKQKQKNHFRLRLGYMGMLKLKDDLERSKEQRDVFGSVFDDEEFETI